MKKITIQESQKNRLFESNAEFEEDFNLRPEDMDWFGIDFSKDPGQVPEDEDDSDIEEEFQEKVLELMEYGAHTFNELKNYYMEHPYAISQEERLKPKLEIIENIINEIEKLYS